jgi:hypothetical protein
MGVGNASDKEGDGGGNEESIKHDWVPDDSADWKIGARA